MGWTYNWDFMYLVVFHYYSASTISTTSKRSEKLEMLTDPSKITVDESTYRGPHVTLPLTLLTVRNIIELYKSHKVGTVSSSLAHSLGERRGVSRNFCYGGGGAPEGFPENVKVE